MYTVWVECRKKNNSSSKCRISSEEKRLISSEMNGTKKDERKYLKNVQINHQKSKWMGLHLVNACARHNGIRHWWLCVAFLFLPNRAYLERLCVQPESALYINGKIENCLCNYTHFFCTKLLCTSHKRLHGELRVKKFVSHAERNINNFHLRFRFHRYSIMVYQQKKRERPQEKKN